jgi:hypothetical protein
MYTAQQLITEAYYLSGIVSVELETVSSAQIFRGLNRLNALLARTTSNPALIPYYMSYGSVFVPRQEKYYIPNLVAIETVTFTIPSGDDPTNSVRYSTDNRTRKQYFGYSRANGISSLPSQWHMERLNDGGDLYFYFLPEQNWGFEVWGKFQLTNVELSTDMSIVNQNSYIEYLVYKLAMYLCQYNNVRFQRDKQEELDSMEKCIKNMSPVDHTQRKLSWFSPSGTPNYGDANLGHGWTP